MSYSYCTDNPLQVGVITHIIDGELHPGFVRVMGKYRNRYGTIVFRRDEHGRVKFMFDENFTYYPYCRCDEFDDEFNRALADDKPVMLMFDDVMSDCASSVMMEGHYVFRQD